MSDVLIIPGPAGLVTADFSFETYLAGVQQADPGLSVSVAAVTADATLYLVSGRPDGEQGEYHEITWEMPGGYAGVHRWPLQFGSPSSIVLPLRQAGVVIGDLGLLLYLDGSSVSTSGLSLAYVSPDYVLSGLPTPAAGSTYTLVFSYGGVVQSFSWPSRPGTLPSLPLAGAGAYSWSPQPGTALTPGGAGELTLSGSGGAGASIGVGTRPGLADLFYGTPSGAGPYSTGVITFPDAGFVHAWAIVDLAGATDQVVRGSWPVAVHSSGYDWLEGEVLDHVSSVWASMGQYESRQGTMSDPPRVVWPNAEWNPEPGQPHLEVRFVWQDRIGFGAQPILHYRGTGLLQHDVYVKEGDGSHGLMLLCDRVEALWREAEIAGLSTYPAGPPREVNAPKGWAARQVDVPFRWEWSP